MKWRIALAAVLLLLAGCKVKWGLDRIGALPPAPYDKGPTLSGHTQVVMVDPTKIDATCRTVTAALPQSLHVGVLPQNMQYRECYDPWNDVGYVPLYPSAAEQERLRLHMLGHARGGAHGDGLGDGAWWDAPWKAFYKPAPIPGN